MTAARLLADLDILVAEDDAANSAVVGEMLTMLGARVELVRDGQGAIAAMTARRFDVVLLDIEMPRMSGLDVLRALPAGDPTTKICLTAHVAQDHVDRAIELGAAGTIAKPIVSMAAFGQRVLDLHEGLEASPVLDRAAFAPLAKAMGPELMGTFTAQLLTDLERCADVLEGAVARADITEVRAQTHILTGVTGSVGAVRLAELSGRLNTAAHLGDIGTLRSALTSLRPEIGRLRATLSAGDLRQ